MDCKETWWEGGDGGWGPDGADPGTLIQRGNWAMFNWTDRRRVLQSQTHPYAVVPGLALGLQGSQSHPVADSAGSLSREAWNSVCDDPNLERTTVLINVILGLSEAHRRTSLFLV